MAQELKEKVETLEKTLQNHIRHTNRGFIKLQDALIDLRLSIEDFKEQSAASIEASRKQLEAQIKADREQLQAQIKSDRERSERDLIAFRTEMNKQWGELANRLGTLAEDVVAPNITSIARKYFQCSDEPVFFAVRIKKRLAKANLPRREFDVLAVYEDLIFLNETKLTPRTAYLDEFAALIPQFFAYFPEYAGLKLIPVFASLYVEEGIVNYATKKGIYVLAMKGGTMDLLNYAQLA